MAAAQSSYGALIKSQTATTTARALFEAVGAPVLITAITAINTAATAGVLTLHLTKGTTFNAANTIYKSGSLAQNANARVWFSDAPILLLPGEKLAIHGSAGAIQVHLFGRQDIPTLRA